MFYYNRNDVEYFMNKNSAEFEVRDSDKSKSERKKKDVCKQIMRKKYREIVIQENEEKRIDKIRKVIYREIE